MPIDIAGYPTTMAGWGLRKHLISLTFAIVLSSCNQTGQATESPRTIGMEKPVGLVFEDLTKMGFCAIRDVPIQCISHAAGIDTITLIARGGHIETVEIQINLGKDREVKFVDNAKGNLGRLARYLSPSLIDGKKWIFEAVDHSRIADCPMMTEIEGFSMLIERITPQTLVGDFEILTITRSQNVRDGRISLDYADECNYATGRYKKEDDNPPF